MFEFWVPAAGLALASAAVLLAALKRAGTQGPRTEAADVRIYKDQLSEVERDLARGTIAPDEGARLRAEVARRLLEADAANLGAKAKVQTGVVVPGVVIGVVLLACIGAYLRLGAPGYPDLPLSERLARASELYNARPTQEAAEAAAGIVGEMPQDSEEAALLEQLRAAVAERPDDLQGHQLLAKSEMSVGNFPAAREAYQRVIEILDDKALPQDHAALAEIMILAADGVVTPQAEAELVTTLTADPRNPVARYYSGLLLIQVGRPDQAFAMWRPLLEESAATDPWVAPIRGQIETLAQAAGVDYVLPDATGPDADDVAAAAEMTPQERQEMISGMVGGLEERLYAQGGSPEDWVKLINALGVLGETDRAATALDAGLKALEGDAAAVERLKRAAAEAGVAP